MAIRIAAFLFVLLLISVSVRAENTAEESAFVLFEAACLHDEGQFDKALALATERSMPVPPEIFRQTLVDKGEGAVWLAGQEPFVALHANLEGGCGVMLKPADEDRIEAITGNLAGAQLVYDDKFQRAWTRWYVLKRHAMKGVLVAGYFGDSDKPSAFLRYMPATGVKTEAESFKFLLADGKIYRAIMKGLDK